MAVSQLDDIIQVKCEVLRSTEAVFLNNLQRSIVFGNQHVFDYIIENVQADSSILNYQILRNSSKEMMQRLFHQKSRFDEFIHKFTEYSDLCCPLTSDLISDFVNSDKILQFNKWYKMYLLIKLSSNDDEKQYSLNSLNCDAIISNYKNLSYFTNKLFCDILYNANYQLLLHFHEITLQHQLQVVFQPQSRESHHLIIKWLLKNLQNIEKNIPVGWRSGPDSGVWPSSQPRDYENTYNFIKKHYFNNDKGNFL